MELSAFAYCNECEDLVEYKIVNEIVEEIYKGKKIQYNFNVGRCKCCNCEVATDIDYNSRKSKARIEAYKKAIDIITIQDISEIMDKYDVGKEALSEIAGFGKVTIKRYFDGYIPQANYSDILFDLLNDEQLFIEKVEENKEKLKDVTYRKIVDRYNRLMEISSSKIEQIANYIIVNLEEVTPLALQKLMSFSHGVNYSKNGTRLINEMSQAWAHGPVYPEIYNKYRKYGYKPIDDGVKSSHGCMLSKLSKEEIEVLDLVIKTFGLYSPKTLERISHTQDPWLEKRRGFEINQPCQEEISEESIKEYYCKLGLNSEESIMNYIIKSLSA